MSSNPSDRRRVPRVTALLKVEYESLDELHADYLTDLSEGGLFIRTSLPLVVGATIDFTLSFPGLLAPMAMQGVVRSKSAKRVNGIEEEGYGLEFVFADEQQRARVKELVSRLSKPASKEGRAFRILIVDDNQVVLDLFRHALNRLRNDDMGGVTPEIATAKDGRKAWTLLDAQPFDLVILDHYLPEVNGIDLLRLIRADSRLTHLPVVVISSDEQQLKVKSLRNGADLFVTKPVQARTLLATLRGLISSAGKDGEAVFQDP